MQLVIADTSPINYLILIGHIDILPALFERVILPIAVQQELANQGAPLEVRNWIASPPGWIELCDTAAASDDSLHDLDSGEAAAIALALDLHADLLLMDDREGIAVAERRGLKVAGTLAVLGMASRRHLLNLSDAFDRLKRTSFHYRQEILDRFLTNEDR